MQVDRGSRTSDMNSDFLHHFPPPSLLPFLLLPLLAASSSLSLDPFTLRQTTTPAMDATVEHLDPTLPPALAGHTPKCSLLVLQHVFADTVGAPPASANYSQPLECPAPWTRVVLELSASASASDYQRHRIAAVWIDGAEILRTSTPFSLGPGTFWRVQKDVTRYTALLRRFSSSGGVVSMILENTNAPLPGIYTANVTLHFYRGGLSGEPAAATEKLGFSYTAHPTVNGLYREPADLIIPISQEDRDCATCRFWFRIENGSHVPTAPVVIPRNAYRAVIEIFSSYHGDDVSWYANPLRSSYLEKGVGAAGKCNGGYRQLYATIDGRFVGGHIPFAVIYPGLINPYFWSPVTAIGAFDHPSYDLDITPFLGLMLDNRPHDIGLGVKYANPYWLMTANLHVWLDSWSEVVEGGLIDYSAPPHRINRHAEWKGPDGGSEVDAEGLTRFSGWVSSSRGNLTTLVRQKVKFMSQVEVKDGGAVRQVDMVNKERTTVGVSDGRESVRRVQLFAEAPLQIVVTSESALGGAVYEKTMVSHQLEETLRLNENGQAVSVSALLDRQDAEGSVLMRGGEAVWGCAETKSWYNYQDESRCYLRTVNTVDGVLTDDTASGACAAVDVA